MNHLQRYLVDEFIEDYQEGQLSRRQALRLVAGITGTAIASQLLAACSPPPAASTPAMGSPTGASTPGASASAAPVATAANSVPANDPSVIAERVRFQNGDTTLQGYTARPPVEGTFPIVLVCHENRGLTPHIEDVTRRLAKAGYIGFAVDLMSRQGGTASITDTDSIPGILSGAAPEQHVQDFKSGLDYVKTLPYAKADKAGMVGFCFGGGVTWLCAAGIPELKAAVPYYGPPVPATEVSKINAAVLAIYAEKDNRITSTATDIEAAMQQNSKTYRKIIYPNADHAFNNDTGQRYNPEAALSAWQETLAWFGQYLA